MKGRKRVDQLLVERGMVEDFDQAERFIMAGQVRADGQLVFNPSQQVGREVELSIDSGPPFVSRGGEKLQAALETFGIGVAGRVCADVGSSTGGFVDCLLKAGAEKVYAIDVGYGQLHWKLREHPRVILMEETDARDVEALPDRVDFISVDVAFISLQLILPAVRGWADVGAEAVMLIKPQFEARREEVEPGGVVTDPEVHRRVLDRVLSIAVDTGFSPQGLIRSPLIGPKGNEEYLLWCRIRRSKLPNKGLVEPLFESRG